MADSEIDLSHGALFGDPPAVPYRVLARKYRPQSFSELIGQEPMVQTLTNAFAAGRIAQAFMLTGVRGVGKTTTARILARGLNFETADNNSGPQIEMAEEGVHCRQIMEGNHVDVLEMDAASHTSIDDIREIIEAVRYRPVSARYKVYIIDEVHMLSKAAFNGLLKTLEEPPPHVKFIFATTEIGKVPVTVLSRCQRFDLRRVPTAELTAHLANLCAQEQVSAATPALAMIARAGEGSVRDALSILDQAIAHEPDGLTEDGLRGMLGLSDRAAIYRLFEAIVQGQTADALRLLEEQHVLGVEPSQIMADLATFNHLIARAKAAPDETGNDQLSPEEEKRAGQFSEQLSIPFLSRNWQMLIKGLQEIQQAPNAIQAADMVVIRLCHAAELPTPDELIKQLQKSPAGNSAPPPNRSQPSADSQPSPQETASAPTVLKPSIGNSGAAQQQQPQAEAPPALRASPATTKFHSLQAILDEAKAQRDIALCYIIEHTIRLVNLEPGRLTINLEAGHPPDAVSKLSQRLQQWSGERWMVALSKEPGHAPLAEQAARQKDRLKTDARLDPLVGKVLEKFPGAEVVDVRIFPATPPEIDLLEDGTVDTIGEESD
jgi:DNA polymerase-3 subunit gamma/tau